MKIYNTSKKPVRTDAFSSVSHLNYALKIFGLSCIYRDKNKLKYNNPIWKHIIFITLFLGSNAYSIYFQMVNHDDGTRFTFMDTVQGAYVFTYLQYISDCVIVYKYGRQRNVDYFNIYDYIDSTIGMTHYNEIRKTINIMIILYFTTATTMTIVDFCAWLVNWDILNVYCIEFLFLVVRMMAILDIVANCIQIKYRLKTIGDILENYYYSADSFSGLIRDAIYDRIWISTRDGGKFNHLDSLKSITTGRHEVLQRLSRCYVLLIEQCDFINLKYGFRMLFSSTLYLLDVVLMLNMMIRILLGSLVFHHAPFDLLWFAVFTRIAMITIIIFSVIYRFEQTYRQRERIIKLIDHLLISKRNSKEMKDTLMELKDVIRSRPVKFHALNFFQLNYATLVSMASVVVTYTIILLQNLQ